MTSSHPDLSLALAKRVRFGEDTLVVELADGRLLTVPIGWFPRLAHGTPGERDQWRLIGRGEGISWPLLDEDLSVESLLAGRRSGESPESSKRWFDDRAGGGGRAG